MRLVANWNRLSSSSGTFQFKRPSDTSAAGKQRIRTAVNDRIGIEPED